jgi:hypothetical protein
MKGRNDHSRRLPDPPAALPSAAVRREPATALRIEILSFSASEFVEETATVLERHDVLVTYVLERSRPAPHSGAKVWLVEILGTSPHGLPLLSLRSELGSLANRRGWDLELTCTPFADGVLLELPVDASLWNRR